MTTIQNRRGTSGTWRTQNPVLADGEMGYETDTKLSKVGNGISDWNSLPYWAGPLPMDGNIPWTQVGDLDPETYRGGVGRKLNVPTHVTPAGGEVTHPSVVFFPTGWQGWRYWMGITPYPAGNDAHEDPNIVVSMDGETWSQPAGVTQPLDNQAGTSGTPSMFNSDTHLFFDNTTGIMYLFWRTVEKTVTPWNEHIYMRTSSNGTTWTAKTLVHTSKADVLAIISPSIEKVGNTWTMWGMDMVSKNIVRRTAATLTTSSWSAVTACTILPGLPADRQNWHIEVRYYNGRYVGVLNDCKNGANGLDGDLYMITSGDGLSWTRARRALIPRNGPQHIALYRASMVPMIRNGIAGFDIWYPGWTVTPNQTWHLFRTWVQPSPAGALSIAHVPPIISAAPAGFSFSGVCIHKKNEDTDQGEVTYHLKWICTAAKSIPATSFLSLGLVIPTHLRSPVDKAYTSVHPGYLSNGVVVGFALNQFSGEILVRLLNTSTAYSAPINTNMWLNCTVPWPDGPAGNY